MAHWLARVYFEYFGVSYLLFCYTTDFVKTPLKPGNIALFLSSPSLFKGRDGVGSLCRGVRG